MLRERYWGAQDRSVPSRNGAIPDAPGGGHRTQLFAPDETAPVVDPVELAPRLPVADRPDAPDPDPAPPPTAEPAVVVVEFAELVPVAVDVVLEPVPPDVVLFVLPLVVAGVVLVVFAGVVELAAPMAGSTTALPFAGDPLR